MSLTLPASDFWIYFFSVLQGKKVDGSVNAYAINVSQKRKYRLALLPFVQLGLERGTPSC